MTSNMPKGDKWELIDDDIDSLNYGKKFKFDFSYISSESMKNIVRAYVWRNYKEGNKVLSKIYYDANVRFKAFSEFANSMNINSLKHIKNNEISMFVSYLKTLISDRTQKPLSYVSQKVYLDSSKAIIRWGQMYIPDEVPKVEIFTGNEYLGVNRKLKIDFIPDDVVKKINIALKEEENLYVWYCIVILQSTGMRIGDMLKLKVDCLKPHPISGMTLTWYDYKNRKERQPMPVTNECAISITKLIEATEELRKQVIRDSNWNGRLNKFISRWDIRDNKGNLYPLHSHQFIATFVRELIKQKVPIAYIMKHFNHVSIEMTAHYLTLQQEEIKELYADMILRPESKTAGLRAEEIKKTLNEQFKGKTEEEIDSTVENLAKSMSFNPLPTGVCLYDFRRGNCSDGDGCFFYNCPNYITEARFYPILKKELELMKSEMKRFKELGRERDWQRQYVKWKYLKPLVDSLEVQVNEA